MPPPPTGPRRARDLLDLVLAEIALGLSLVLDFALGQMFWIRGDAAATAGATDIRQPPPASTGTPPAPRTSAASNSSTSPSMLERTGHIGAPTGDSRRRQRLAGLRPGQRICPVRPARSGRPHARDGRGAALRVYGHGPQQRSRASESPGGWCACDTSDSTCAARPDRGCCACSYSFGSCDACTPRMRG